ncbi:DUF4407 domain-containing protein [Aliikangiella coralliicola]|uniref:DUF4407 domain-containing protein n=1 Tax=Aliikangiella coralliicola TaxID=2592383 RepID=A0A545UJB8_9GAMM|nr:DUF4407 domain-containing protein [Aliikangiella coralliicola]TQV89533.1 DUF4407 domain-containing protein [Aliikangiella coralliicola]
MSDSPQPENKPVMAVSNDFNQHKQHDGQQDSRLFKFFSFLSLTDYEVLRECGKYDRTLVYAMVFRQLVTFAFTCLLFTYGVSMFLSFEAAIVVGFIFALTLFFLDQAIIGSDWALKNPFKGGIPFRSLMGLLPRIIYSLIIAVGLATLAEISLQANAIDEQIQKESNEKNREYFAKLEKYEQELETGISVDRKKVEDIQVEIQQLSERKTRYELASKTNDADTLGNTLAVKQSNLSELQHTQQVLISEISSINERLAKSREEYSFWFNEALLERTGKDGRAPTEGPKYRRAVATYTDLQEQINLLEGSLTDAQAKLEALKPGIETATSELNEVQKERNDLVLNETSYEQIKEDIFGLQEKLVVAKTDLNLAIEKKQQKLDEYRVKLEKDGLFYEVKTGMLRRYLALKNIHSDPEIGQAASLFSLLLKIFFIAIELMPVIIKLFFSPFSFYSLRMYRKMQIALLEEEELLEAAKAERKKARENRIKEAGELDAVNAI